MKTQEWVGQLEKLDEYRWRIPKTGGMRVPGLVFADEKLLEDITSDQALQQVANVAHLPGILKASMAMPDIHWGYGFPIGGVAAMDTKEGVISPGGVGYDINCLSGETAVLHRLGYRRRLSDIVEKSLTDDVRCYRLNQPQIQAAAIAATLRKRPTTSVLELTTVSGRRIIGTADHPFLTPAGMRLLGSLQAGDAVAADPFEGVCYERPSRNVLVDEEDVRGFLLKRGKDGGNGIPQVLRFMRQRNLLPIQQNSAVLPVLIKALGFVMGDGTMHFLNGTGNGVTWFFGQPEDLEDIRKDLSLWFTCSRVYSRRRTHRIETDYGHVRFESINACFRIGSTAFATLLALLGCPIGNKSLQNYGVPEWLFGVPSWQKRLFLAAYFGAELQSPRSFAERNRNFPCPILTVQKNERYAGSGRRFLSQIANLMKEFGVETLGIEERRERVRRKHGISHRLRLLFSSRPEHLRLLYTRIGFEYHRKKRAEAAVVAAYQASKETAWAVRRDAMEKILELRATSGVGAKKILAQLIPTGASTTPQVNLRFVERTIYGGADRTVRVEEDFESYPEFRKRVTKGLEGSGLVWETIQSICPRHDVEQVYDITVDHPDHNFVANGFIVHNCGVRLIRTDLTVEEVQPKLRTLVASLFNEIPCGVGMSGEIRVGRKDAGWLLSQGSRWVIGKGYGVAADAAHTESQGCLPDADPSAVSERALERGHDQLGTLGSGNHFLEVQAVDTVYDGDAAGILGLREGQITVMIHSGSRGFGYQICDDYLDVTARAMAKYGISVPDRQLACAPINSEEGRAYLGAMRCAANYAWANRQCLMHLMRLTFERVFETSWETLGMHLVYDVAHNIAKFERHRLEGREMTLCVHRKGATRAFPPGHPELPDDYRAVGQPVIIPGDMGRHSYVLVGTEAAMEETFGSCCHGAGRVMSRSEAVRQAAGRSIEQELERRGIIVMGRGRKGVAEEQPAAYKDVNDVVRVVHNAGLARRVARMRPLGVIKG